MERARWDRRRRSNAGAPSHSVDKTVASVQAEEVQMAPPPTVLTAPKVLEQEEGAPRMRSRFPAESGRVVDLRSCLGVVGTSLCVLQDLDPGKWFMSVAHLPDRPRMLPRHIRSNHSTLCRPPSPAAMLVAQGRELTWYACPQVYAQAKTLRRA